MKYHCGHRGCDICGARECTKVALKKYFDFIVCDCCLKLALKLAVQMAETFGGTIIDPAKKCGEIRI